MELIFILFQQSPADKSITLKDWSEIAKNAFTIIAIIVGGGWALWRYFIFRDGKSKIEFNLDCNFIGKIGDTFLIELVGIVENKGLTTQFITNWWFDLRVFRKGDILVEKCLDSGFNKQTKFDEKLLENVSWVHDIQNGLSVDAGTTQKFTYLTSISSKTLFIYIYSKFEFDKKKRNDFQTAPKTCSEEKHQKVELLSDREHIPRDSLQPNENTGIKARSLSLVSAKLLVINPCGALGDAVKIASRSGSRAKI